MCGIVGILHRDLTRSVNKEILLKMNNCMSYRGPDENGFFYNKNIGLGHRRLSIIDLKSGHQPMINTENNNAIVYNGEIYNFQTLKNNLINKGITFHTSCDTEVLLHLVDSMHLGWMESLNGMFAFAFWEDNNKTLLLARDRMGIKPLYYIDLGDTFVFSSEIKPILLYPGVSREVNESKIAEYLSFRSIAGEETLYKNIYQVPPGHIMLFQPPNYVPNIIRYWNETLSRETSSCIDFTQSYSQQLNDLLIDSIEHRLISDVPLGTYNSGGVDSSLVTAMVKKLKGRELHTFSVGFAEKSHDESKYAQIVSKQFNTIHHEIIIGEDDYLKGLHDTLWHLEEPINHAHTVQLLYLSKLTKNYVTVVLTGEGADELFAGYPRYNIQRIYQIMNAIPKCLSNGLISLLKTLKSRRINKLNEFIGFDEENMILQNSRYVPLFDLKRIELKQINLSERKSILDRSLMRSNNNLDRLLYYDQRTYLPSLLNRLDKMSMAASIEARVPFLDYRIIEWSYSLPIDQKISLFRNKWIVKKVAKEWLPNIIIKRKKVGFGVPIGKWMRNKRGLGQYLDLITDKKASERGYYNTKITNQLVNEHISGSSDHSEILWSLLNYEFWQREFIDKMPAIK